MRQESKGPLAMLLGLIVLVFFVDLMGEWWAKESVVIGYPTQITPKWVPQSYFFSSIWSTLYLLTAIAMWFVWKKPTAIPKTAAYVLFGAQLFFSLLWFFFFFNLESPFSALLVSVVLSVLVLATLISFYRVSHGAAWLLAPYFLWIIFVTALNGAIVF